MEYKYGTLDNGDIIFVEDIPVEWDGYTQDKHDPKLWHLDFPKCKFLSMATRKRCCGSKVTEATYNCSRGYLSGGVITTALLCLKCEDRNKDVQMDFESLREPCDQCTFKHLAKGYILLGEVLDGYDHIDLAVSQLNLARNDQNAKKIDQMIRDIADECFIDKVRSDINKWLLTSEKRYYWRMIGNLSEAEEETHNIEHRTKIRAFRIRIMNGYSPKLEDFEQLLEAINEGLPQPV